LKEDIIVILLYFRKALFHLNGAEAKRHRLIVE